MDPITSYIFIYFTLLVVNTIPVLMPPSWIILILFAVNLKLPVLPLVLVGLAGSTSGRILLYYLSSAFFSKILSPKRKDHMKALGEILKTKRRLFIPLILTFSLLPVPSDDVFIAAGMTRFNLRILVLCFIIGRFPINLLLVATSTLASPELIRNLNSSITSWPAVLIEIGGVALLFLMTEIHWKHTVRHHYRRFLTSQI